MSSDVIRLLDSGSKSVLDIISTEYEDSFCLDTFGELVQAHRETAPPGSKQFIIARVQTWDHKQPERAFFSYYAAHHLNKILIKTQRHHKKRLIHRLHVLNPLTNTDIIGNVSYFIVQAEPTEIQVISATATSTVKSTSLPDGSANIPEVTLNGNVGSKVDSTPVITLVNSLPWTDESDGSKISEPGSPVGPLPTLPKPGGRRARPTSLTIQTTPPAGTPGHTAGGSRELVPPSPTVRQVESGSECSWTMSAPSAVEAPPDEDDALLGLSAPPATSDETANATLPQTKDRRKSIFAGILSPRRKSTVNKENNGETPTRTRFSMRNRATTDHQIKKNLAPTPAIETQRTVPAENSPTSASLSPTERRHFSAGDAHEPASLDRQPSKTPSMSASAAAPPQRPEDTKVSVPAGQITRFAVPLTPAERQTVAPPTTKGRRRTLSYHNAVSASGEPASFDDWLAMMLAERRVLSATDAVQEEEERDERYDKVAPFAGVSQTEPAGIFSPRDGPAPEVQEDRHSILSPTVFTIEDGKGTVASDTGTGPITQGPEETSSAVHVYDAVLFATDIDFLEQSRIRGIFRDNALTPDDAKLFEIPPVLEEDGFDFEVEMQRRRQGDMAGLDDDMCWCC
ncbi:hypothetical protein DFS34DRAFT_628576 [Phlyctochytrium arcticum]|nr:hypothetical protein DFS34DRAFT_628576 [Phlyctochytrium arcticum]